MFYSYLYTEAAGNTLKTGLENLSEMSKITKSPPQILEILQFPHNFADWTISITLKNADSSIPFN